MLEQRMPLQTRTKKISDHEWVIYDAEELEKTGIGIVGFIEQRFGTFEVLSFHELSKRAFFSTFDEALAFLTPTVTA